MKRPSAFTAAAPSPLTRAGSAAVSQIVSPSACAWPVTRAERRVPDAAPRRVDDARERDDVGGIREQRQVRDGVLDLRALVELGAADHLIGDVAAHQLVLDHARHRVRAVEHGDLGRRGALVDQTLGLADDVARLGVLIGEFAQLHGVAGAEIAPELLLMPPRLLAITAFATCRIVSVER